MTMVGLMVSPCNSLLFGGDSGPGTFVFDEKAIEGVAFTIRDTDPEATDFQVRINGVEVATITAAESFQYVRAAEDMVPGTFTAQTFRDGSPESPLVTVTVAARAPTVTEPDGDEEFPDGTAIPWAATVFDDDATTSVTAELLDDEDNVLDTDTDSSAAGGWSGTLDSTGLGGTTPRVRITRNTAGDPVSAAPVTVSVRVPNPVDIFDGSGGGATIHTWLPPEDWTLVSGAVDIWHDRSGNGNDHTAPTAGVRPAVTASWKNGVDAANFEAGGDRLACAAYHAGLTQPCMKVVVGDFTNIGSSRVVVSGVDTTNRIQIASVITAWRVRANTTADWASAPVINTPYLMRYTLALDAGAGTDTFHVNDTQRITADTGDVTEAGCTMGSDSAGANGHAGRIGELIQVTGTPTAGQLTALATYIASVWGSF